MADLSASQKHPAVPNRRNASSTAGAAKSGARGRLLFATCERELNYFIGEVELIEVSGSRLCRGLAGRSQIVRDNGNYFKRKENF
jgi:hypothetical protein